MLRILILLITLSISTGNLFAQKDVLISPVPPISFGLTFIGVNGMTTGGLSELNTVFTNNNIPILSETYQSIGFSFRYLNKKRVKGFEMNFQRMTTFLPKNDTSSVGVLPRIQGRSFKIKYIRNYLNQKRWFGTWEVGVSATVLTLNIIDIKGHTSSFSTLLGNPSLSSTLNFTQRTPDNGVDGSVSIFYRTNSLKTLCSELWYGFRIGYYQPLKRGSDWTENGTGNNFVNGDLPIIKLDNFYIQFSLHLCYDFREGKVFQSKKR